MPVVFNGSTITSIRFNGTNVAKVIFQDQIVFCQSCTASVSSCGVSCTANNSTSGGCSPTVCCKSGSSFGQKPFE